MIAYAVLNVLRAMDTDRSYTRIWQIETTTKWNLKEETKVTNSASQLTMQNDTNIVTHTHSLVEMLNLNKNKKKKKRATRKRWQNAIWLRSVIVSQLCAFKKVTFNRFLFDKKNTHTHFSHLVSLPFPGSGLSVSLFLSNFYFLKGISIRKEL